MTNRRVEFRYDPEVDAAYIPLADGVIDRTVDLEEMPLKLPVLVDLDSSGRIVGIEILHVSSTVGPGESIGQS
ncbi:MULTISPECIES: DUF2283 domain-containing protein [unclassified Microbacterium]|uniref:DUF2283 domain-containing protein n=1 Tax=unclassified Microbacterium TaxID=2609290 RepID=UPI000EA8A8AF|nr:MULTISPECIES: DUF2283 domain-containing protein [unclassified Microbacterium]MBT2484258.1 DUF2283 domain-containing protein [Microbacterium sp. ISL-108]RKN67181.1 DUF2283 domain-containing protein [Microbacterium sp. CGR2]